MIWRGRGRRLTSGIRVVGPHKGGDAMRLFVLTGLLVLAVLVSGLKAEDKDKDTKKEEKPKDISEIMKKAHAGDEAFLATVKGNVKDKEFDKAATTTKAWVAIGSHLGEFKPPKGE